MVHQDARQYEAAERAYQQSLRINVQTGNRAGEALTLGQLGNLYATVGRSEDAVRFYRQAADVFVDLRDPRNEGAVRNNAAIELIRLGQFDDARLELERAITCKKPFGHAAEPWKTFDNLRQLEQALGNDAAAAEARRRAMEAYLAYRRAGGFSQTPVGELFALIASDPAAARDQLPAMRQLPGLSTVLSALEAILAGSRDPALAEDPNLPYREAAELLLLIEALSRPSAPAI
jgi:tetratricopeptide (TPR) repeat protein